MGFSKSPFAFEDIKTMFDKALAAPKGIRIRCTTYGAAIALRSRFNYFRKVDRAENRKIYEADHPRYGWSVYDGLVLRVPPADSGDTNLYIEPRSAEGVTVEEI